MIEPVYMDYNATTPLDPQVRTEITAGLELWGNPSSPYSVGTKAKAAVEKARSKVAEMIGAQSCEITFTSGGTESNHMAIWTAIHHFRKNNCNVKPEIITTNIEHCAITAPLRKLEAEGLCTVRYIPAIKGSGRVSANEVISGISDATALITIILANNETGIIQPVKEIFREAREVNKRRSCPILLHTDAAQTIGKMKTNVDDLQADMLTIVGHKFYGPRIGALYHRSSTSWQPAPLFYGGGQERGLRSGTENTPMIVGLGAAATLVSQYLDEYSEHMKSIRDYLRDGLIRNFKLVVSEVNPSLETGQVFWRYLDAQMLPNTLSVRFGGTTGRKMLDLLEDDLQASTGAACHTGGSVSQILLNSWDWGEQGAEQTIRLSVGRETTMADIDRVVEALRAAVFD